MFLPWFLGPAEGLDLNFVGGELQGPRPLSEPSFTTLSSPALGQDQAQVFLFLIFQDTWYFTFLYPELRLGSLQTTESINSTELGKIFLINGNLKISLK